ncbi:metal-dependent hydrolase [soil metagenome]
MATIFSHALVGATIVSALPLRHRQKRNYLIGAFAAVVPDFDYIGFVSHVPYASLWGHRGLTHSVIFALVCGTTCALLANRKGGIGHVGWALIFFASTISHGLLDACTNGGLGVAFFAPYTNERYFFSHHPIQVSPMGLSFFSLRGVNVLVSEFCWIVLPCLVFIFLRKRLDRARF